MVSQKNDVFGDVLIDVTVKKAKVETYSKPNNSNSTRATSRDVDHLTMRHFVRTFVRGSIFCPQH